MSLVALLLFWICFFASISERVCFVCYACSLTAGTDEKTIWKILTARNSAKRQRISAEYTTIYGRVCNLIIIIEYQ